MIRARDIIRVIVWIAAAATACSAPAAFGPKAESAASLRLRQALFEAEDSRAPEAASLNVLLGALDHSEPGIRRTAVRALGRLVRPELISKIVPVLSDPAANVRAEAANALAQSLADLKTPGREAGPAGRESDARGGVLSLLETRLKQESDSRTRGVLLQSIGRLKSPDEPSFRRAEKLLWEATVNLGAGSDSDFQHVRLGALKGIESLYRLKIRSMQASGALVDLLKSTARLTSGAAIDRVRSRDSKDKEEEARVRRLSLMALTWAGALDEAVFDAVLTDPDEQVRRLVFFGWGRMPEAVVSEEAAEKLIARGLSDPAGAVRYEALRIRGRMRLDRHAAAVLEALADSSPHVRFLAVDLLGQLKAAPEEVEEKLKEIALPIQAGTQASSDPAAARALVSLAKIAPARAREILPRFMAAPAGLGRAYAAAAALVLKDVPALERLADDPLDNVRNEALSGLISLLGREADLKCLAALERNDYQLILTAVRGLKGTSRAETAVPALLSALARLTAERRETSRDPRLAILERLGELGPLGRPEALSIYAEDFDPLVASAAADIAARWTGRRPDVRPQKIPAVFPRLADIDPLRSASVRVTMASGGTFEMVLFVDEAPATVGRVAALVRRGYYDGLTIHRIVPNFLIQGGSPGANEFMGDALFMRDESGLASNLRGTVGISTRGRDTGDAQLYINTVDNDRLDHDYCVFGRVIRGMDVVDRIQEGAVIARMEILIP